MTDEIKEGLIALVGLVVAGAAFIWSLFKLFFASVLAALFGAIAGATLGFLFPGLAGTILAITMIAPYQWGLIVAFIAHYFRKVPVA